MATLSWRQFAKRQQKIETEFIPKMEAAIRGEVNKAIDHYKANGNIGNVINSMAIAATLKDLYHTSAISEATISYRTNYRLKRAGLGTNEAWNKAVDTYLMQHNVFNTVEQINATTKKRVLEIISKGVQDGASVDQIVQMLQDDDIPLKRATLIVRTESIGAMNMGSMMGAISTGIIYMKKWNTAGDHRVRGNKPKDQFNHVILSGQIVDMDKPFNNGQNMMFPGDKRASAGNFCNCFLPDQLTSVNPKHIKKVFRSVYDGDVITVHTTNGKSFTCTPNHPILTSQGWVNAGLLTKGSYLVNSDFINDSVFPEFNVKNSPTSFEQVFSSFEKMGIISNMPGTVMDFYGDSTASNVNIVDVDSELLNRIKVLNEIGNGILQKSNFRKVTLASDGSLNKPLGVGFWTKFTNSILSLVSKSLSFIGGCISHPYKHAFASVSLDNTQFVEPQNDTLPGTGVSLSNLFNAETGIVEGSHFINGDNCFLIVDVVHKNYSGFVYTLETVNQIYDINGMVAKNCRCNLSYIAKRDERGRIMRYPELSPTMGVGADGKLNDILFQLIVGQILGGILETVINSDNSE